MRRTDSKLFCLRILFVIVLLVISSSALEKRELTVIEETKVNFSPYQEQNKIERKRVEAGNLFGARSEKRAEKQNSDSNKQDKFRTEPEYNREEIELLARAVRGEAEGEPYEGQVAVAAVILNRVKDSRFPNTVYNVIYQKNQFSIVSNGRINRPPNESAYQAAKAAINGKDPSQGALYFYNPDTAANRDFFASLETVTQISNHVFARSN